MVSINTNLSSLIVQGNLTSATTGLNKAIERLSTGYKINHASDNAANYSIANSYESKMSSYEVAASNVQSGLDLLSVAQDTISTMQDHGARLQALITQARNGTYGTQSLTAMTQEAGALISEIQRMYTNAEYNGISLFDNFPLPDWAKEVKSNAGIEDGETVGIAAGQTVGLKKDITPKANGFIADIVTVNPEIVVESADDLADAIENNSIIGVANADVLHELATLVNGGTACTGKTIVLTDDIDLSDYQTGQGWTTIGYNSTYKFDGTFDGQGHKITGLYINRPNNDSQGLFGYLGDHSKVKNLAIIDCNIKGHGNVGAVTGYITKGTIYNTYATGTVTGTSQIVGGLLGRAADYGSTIDSSYTVINVTSTGTQYTGGIAGISYGKVTNSFAKGNVTGTKSVGGLVGYFNSNNNQAKIENCYSTGDVTSSNGNAGGLVGLNLGSAGIISYSYATGSVNGVSYNGGLAGTIECTVKNCYATGEVTGTGSNTGGLIGRTTNSVQNSYATGAVSGNGQYYGGLVGITDTSRATVTNCYATGNITGNNNSIGGLVGDASGNITNSYAEGKVVGVSHVGGLVGLSRDTSITISNSYATGDVTGSGERVGGFVGTCQGYINNCYATGNVTSTGNLTGGLVGILSNATTISNSYATGSVSGTGISTGGLVGYIYTSGIVTDCYATGNVTSTGNLTGGLVGDVRGTINNSFATGDVTGAVYTGGLIGRLTRTANNADFDKLFSSGKVSGNNKSGSLIGGIANTTDGSTFLTVNITNAKVVDRGMDVIGFEGTEDGTVYESGQMTTWLQNIKKVSSDTKLQVGIMGDESSKISFDTGFAYDLSSILTDIKSDKAYSAITKFMSTLSAKATDLGAVSNRLESSLESIAVNMQNLGDSLSTVKDVDMAEVSSEYIKKQILQQASATLLATANQSPAIALQLI